MSAFDPRWPHAPSHPWRTFGRSVFIRRNRSEAGMARVTGIGGVFFKATGDKKTLAEWYRKNLGMALEDWGGAILKWPDDRAEDKGITVWHVAEAQSQWFS